MSIENLEQLIDKAKECTTVEEVVELIKESGLELTDDELAQIAGGLPALAGLEIPLQQAYAQLGGGINLGHGIPDKPDMIIPDLGRTMP